MGTTQIKNLIQGLFTRAQELQIEANLSDLTKIHTDRLQEIQSTPSTITSSEYEALCNALVVDSARWYRQEEPPSYAIARFRTAFFNTPPTGADLRQLLLAAETGRVLKTLMNALGKEIKLETLRNPTPLSATGKPWEDGYCLGEDAREALSPKQEPLFDLEALLVEAGVHIITLQFSAEEIEAASLWGDDSVPVIVLNTNSKAIKNPGRWRTTLAHELCHLLHDADNNKLTTRVSWGAEQKGDHEQDVERRARAFAPAFLAPPTWLNAWAKNNIPPHTSDIESVSQIANHWGLSFEGAKWHAMSCGIIPQQKHILGEQDDKPWVEFTPFKTSTTPSEGIWGARALTYIQQAADDGIISAGRAKELRAWR